MNRPQTVHVVVPDGITDPSRPSGGNAYDQRLCQDLAAGGWSVRTRAVAGCLAVGGGGGARRLAGGPRDDG